MDWAMGASDLNHLAGELGFELLGGSAAESGMQSLLFVNLFDVSG